MKRSTRKFEAAFKARVALEAIKGHKTIAEISSAFGIHSTQIAKWKSLALAELPSIFSGPRAQLAVADTALIDSLYQQIGQQKVELDWLKKKSGFFT